MSFHEHKSSKIYYPVQNGIIKKVILCFVLISIVFCFSAKAIEIYGNPMNCRVQIEDAKKDNVMQQVIDDMNEEGYSLMQRSSIYLLFEAPLRKSNRFNYATSFGQHWFPKNEYGWKRQEFCSPVYQLSVNVIKKTVTSVEVEISPIIVWNPGNAFQEEIYEYDSKTKRAINEYLSSLKSKFVYEYNK